MTLEFQVLTWDRHKQVARLNPLMGSQPLNYKQCSLLKIVLRLDLVQVYIMIAFFTMFCISKCNDQSVEFEDTKESESVYQRWSDSTMSK